MALPGTHRYGFMFHGSFAASEIRRLERRTGVYIVRCACCEDSYALEIGESTDVQSYLLAYFGDKTSCKCPNGSTGGLSFAAFYCPDGGKHDRKELLAKIRKRAGVESNS